MVFDVVTHEAVGTNCYVVGSVPAIGDVKTYETFPAEFVAASNGVFISVIALHAAPAFA
jgi:hypothetical protein